MGIVLDIKNTVEPLKIVASGSDIVLNRYCPEQSDPVNVVVLEGPPPYGVIFMDQNGNLQNLLDHAEKEFDRGLSFEFFGEEDGVFYNGEDAYEYFPHVWEQVPASEILRLLTISRKVRKEMLEIYYEEEEDCQKEGEPKMAKFFTSDSANVAGADQYDNAKPSTRKLMKNNLRQAAIGTFVPTFVPEFWATEQIIKDLESLPFVWRPRPSLYKMTVPAEAEYKMTVIGPPEILYDGSRLDKMYKVKLIELKDVEE